MKQALKEVSTSQAIALLPVYRQGLRPNEAIALRHYKCIIGYIVRFSEQEPGDQVFTMTQARGCMGRAIAEMGKCGAIHFTYQGKPIISVLGVKRYEVHRQSKRV